MNKNIDIAAPLNLELSTLIKPSVISLDVHSTQVLSSSHMYIQSPTSKEMIRPSTVVRGDGGSYSIGLGGGGSGDIVSPSVLGPITPDDVTSSRKVSMHTYQLVNDYITVEHCL